MTVSVVGSGPAVEAVTATLTDADVPVEQTDLSDLPRADLGVVVGLAGSDGFRQANERGLDGDTPWIAIEVGGIGGTPMADVDAAVSALGPHGPCFECLRTRVASVDSDTAPEPRADRTNVRLAGVYAGQLAIRILSGEAVAGTVVEVPYAERELHPAPHCTCAHEGDGTFEHRVLTRSLGESLDHAERAIDERIGIVPEVGEHESFPAPYYLATVADTTTMSDGSAPGQAAGVDGDWNGAFMKALGEALERYSAAIYRTSSFREATVEEVDGVPPTDFVRPDDAQTPGASDPLRWVEGTALRTDDPEWLPAEFVHFPPHEERFTTPITTGLGLGNDPVEAALSGLYEIVERDATMLAWYSTFEPLELTVDDEAFRNLARRARGEGLSVTPLLVTQDVDVPVVSVAVHREDWPSFAVGSAADLDGRAAARSALAEALQNWMELRNMGAEAAAEAEGAIGRYADYPRAVRSMTQPTGQIDVDSVGPAVDGGREAVFDAVLDRVTTSDLEPYVVDLTPRDVERIGFSAVRVLVPSAQPLFVDQAFFGERASSVPRDLGFEPRLDRPFHPYP
ncbi:MAG: YcaO-like family protein [Halanaeroarchaeum sp.]